MKKPATLAHVFSNLLVGSRDMVLGCSRLDPAGRPIGTWAEDPLGVGHKKTAESMARMAAVGNIVH